MLGSKSEARLGRCVPTAPSDTQPSLPSICAMTFRMIGMAADGCWRGLRLASTSFADRGYASEVGCLVGIVDRTFISVVSIAEIRRGVALMAKGRKRDALAEWLARDLTARFEHRIISVEERVALTWGILWAMQNGAAEACHRLMA